MLNRLARADHVKRRFASAVFNAFHGVAHRLGVEAHADRAGARGDVNDTGDVKGLLQEGREGVDHKERARGVGCEGL